MDWFVISAVIAAVVGLIAIIKGVAPTAKRFFHSIFRKRGEQLDRIEAELKPNGGASLRDAVERIQRKSEATHALLQAQLSSSGDAIFIADVNGDVTWTSPTFQRLVGRSSGELLGKGWINSFPQRIRDKVMFDWYEHAVNDSRNFEHCAQITAGPGGQELHVLIVAIKMLDSEGHPIGYFGQMKVYDDIV